MSLDIGDAVREGLGRTTTREGLLLAAAFAVVGVATAVLQHTVVVGLAEVTAELAEQQGQDPGFVVSDVRASFPLALSVSLGVGALLVAGLALASEFVSILAVRTFAADEGVPVDLLRRPARATLSGFVGGLVVRVLVVVGLVLLVVPGLFLLVAFTFFRQAVALEDENFLDAMTTSWSLTAGDRLELFALLLVLGVVQVVARLAGSAVGVVDAAAGSALAAAAFGAVGAFVAAAVTRAYLQVRDGEDGEDDEDDEFVGALGPEDIDPPE